MGTKKKTPQEVGKDFEDHLQAAMKLLQQKHKFTFIRLYDSHSAGSFLPAQPGDFCGVAQGRGFLMEAKSSAKVATLHGNKSVLSSNMGTTQAAAMKIWYRAGAVVLVPFLAQGTGEVEFWDGKYLAEIFSTPRARPEAGLGVILTVPNWHKDTLYTALKTLLIDKA